MKLDFGYLIAVFFILPTLFYMCALFFNSFMSFLDKNLPDKSWLKAKINAHKARKNIQKTADKIDMVFTLAIVLLAILLTFYYS